MIACWASSSRCALPSARRRAGGAQLALERLGDLGGAGRDGDPGLEALDDRGEVAAADGAGDGDEGQMRVGEPDERERLARRDGGVALAAEQHGLPAAVQQRGLEAVATGRAAGVHGPARSFELVRDLDRVGLGHVCEQDSE